MKKIMFNDKYGLTAAVIERWKTNTRRTCKDKATNKPIPASYVHSWRYYPEENIVEFVMNDGSVKVAVPPYKVGEVVAVAQRYSDLSWDKRFYVNLRSTCERLPQYELKGWNNKMFVRAAYMPHQVRFTDMNIEPLRQISIEDCLREGVFMREEEHPRQEWNPEYTFGDGKYHAQNPRAAFAALIDKVSGKGTWNRNPWVFAYTFKLEK